MSLLGTHFEIFVLDLFTNIDCSSVLVLYLYGRYKVHLRVIEDTDSTTFILFDKEANSLLNKSCAEIFETHNKVILAHL